MSTCDNCGNLFDHYATFYTDICDSCAEKVEGKTIAELEKEDARFDETVQ